MKFLKQTICIFLIVLIFSCKKEELKVTADDKYDKAISQISHIVNGKGKVFKIEQEKSSNNFIGYGQKEDTVQKLTIDQFEKVFYLLSNKTISATKAELINSKDTIQIKTNSIRSNDEIEGYDSLRPAGSYRADFALFPSQFYNQNTGGFYNLHLNFQTNSFGQVIGEPKVYLTGIGLSGWQQVSVSAISFNKALTTSTFIVHGVTTFGISFSNGGMTLGFTMERDYLFNITMESFFSNKAVYVEQN